MTNARHPVGPGQAGFFRLLGTCKCEVRFEVFVAVLLRPDDVGRIAQRVDLELSHVSRYLQQLLASGFVERADEGHYHVFSRGAAIREVVIGEAMTFTVLGNDGSAITARVPPHLYARARQQLGLVVIPQEIGQIGAGRAGPNAGTLPDAQAHAREGSSSPRRRRANGRE